MRSGDADASDVRRTCSCRVSSRFRLSRRNSAGCRSYTSVRLANDASLQITIVVDARMAASSAQQTNFWLSESPLMLGARSVLLHRDADAHNGGAGPAGSAAADRIGKRIRTRVAAS